MDALCRHCGKNRQNRPRGLCYACWKTPAIKALYPARSKYYRPRDSDFYGGNAPPDMATTARPGTPEKLAAMALRAQGRRSLWHAQDATAGSLA